MGSINLFLCLVVFFKTTFFFFFFLFCLQHFFRSITLNRKLIPQVLNHLYIYFLFVFEMKNQIFLLCVFFFSANGEFYKNTKIGEYFSSLWVERSSKIKI